MEPSVASTKSVRDWVQVPSAAHYDAMNYLPPDRMAAIGYQFRLLHQYFPEGRVLEVGVGSGLAAHLLRSLNHEVATLDVDERLNPDLLGSVTAIPSQDDSFDSFTCCQVLEHLEWKHVPDAVSELARVSAHGGVISVPTNRPTIGISLHNYHHCGSRTFRLPKLRKQRVRCPREHHWELEANITTDQFREVVEDTNLTIIHEIQPIQMLYHHFFVVKKTNATPRQ